MIGIKKPEELFLQDGIKNGIKHGTRSSWGGNQEWYKDVWQRKAGCGPTACANLIWYLSKAHQEVQELCTPEDNSTKSMLRLMEEVWPYVTPGSMGVNSTGILAEGAVGFGKAKGILLLPETLDVPASPWKRPGRDQVKRFLVEALSDDLPVAFLNLSNGSLKNLESWHWVTLISLDEEQLTSKMIDQGRHIEIDLNLWLRTTNMGGGFVVLRPAIYDLTFDI